MIRDVPLMTLIQPIVMHHHLGFGPSWMTTFCDDLLEGHNQTITYKGISCSDIMSLRLSRYQQGLLGRENTLLVDHYALPFNLGFTNNILCIYTDKMIFTLTVLLNFHSLGSA